MKMTLLPLLTTLLVGASVSAQAQDFRAVPASEQPNAAELSYLGGRNPNLSVINGPDSACVRLVTSFLHDLTDGQLEAAHQRLAGGFVAYGSADKLETNDLLTQWDRNGRLFTDQHLTIERTATTTLPTGENRGTWVYVKAVWSAVDGRESGKAVRVPFHQVARVNNGRIERTYTSYGTDQLFYGLGFALYTGPSGVAQHR